MSVMAEVEEVKQLQTESNSLPQLTAELTTALDQWQKASLDITGRVMDDVDLVGVCSVNYLMLCGTVLGGWLMAKSALVAMEKTSEDPDFYGAKIITLNFTLHISCQSRRLCNGCNGRQPTDHGAERRAILSQRSTFKQKPPKKSLISL